MAALSRVMKVLAGLSVLSGAYASPLVAKIEEIKSLLGRDTFEWTAFGDSYSSGVEAGAYVSNSYRCLRYDHAYPALIDVDAKLPAGSHLFHNAVCSGSNTSDVEAYQFYDKDEFGKPTWQYGDRPRFGNPSMATLSIGGNDIDFPGIIFNCILEWHLPLDVAVPKRTCPDQRKYTWMLLNRPDLANNIARVIQKIGDRARKGPVGDQFKLYVTGFPQFFSEVTNECDSVTFARKANPKSDGKPHNMMTQALRKEFNSMSVQLNKAIADAVSRHSDAGATWIQIDDLVEGHRFCEPGIQEPDQQNKNLWLYHYPYQSPEPRDDAIDGPLLNAFNNVTAGIDFNTAYPSYSDFENAMLDAMQINGDPSEQGWQDFVWYRIGLRVKTFHPQVPLHEKIRDRVLDAYISALKSQNSPAQDVNACHGISGDYWVMSRDVAVDNANAFCSQGTKTMTYNTGSVNELSLSVQKIGDDSKGPTDDPACLGRLQNGVIDGCDGADQINNPHNYKFGSTLTTADGWVYTMTPLSKQVNEVSCDVSYRFWYDSIEIRGKNLPDATLGANGEGLRQQLLGCGDITDWNFERTPDDVKFQWYATCSLPIGVKNCVGSALTSAGGADIGNCHGPGKRASSVVERRPYGIEDWPGYSDESKHVFRHPWKESRPIGGRDSIDSWPGYGDAAKHVFEHPTNDTHRK